MSKKLGIGLGILVVLAVISLVWEKSGSQKTSERVGQALIAINQVPAIDRIEIKEKDKVLQLKANENRTWLVEEGETAFPVDASRIVALLDQLSKVQIQRLISTKEEKWEDLELKAGKELNLWQGEQKLVGIVIGKTRSGGGQYIGFADQPESYLIDETLKFDTNTSAWHLKTLLNLAKEQIKAVSIKPKDEAAAFGVSREKAEDPLVVLELGEQEQTKASGVDALVQLLGKLSYVDKLAKSDEATQKVMNQGVLGARIVTFDQGSYQLNLYEQPGDAKSEDNKDPKYFAEVVFEGDEKHPDYELYRKHFSPWLFQIDLGSGKTLLKGKSDYVEVKPAASGDAKKGSSEG